MSMPWIFLVTSQPLAGYLVWLPGLYVMHMWRLLWHALYFVTSQKPPSEKETKKAPGIPEIGEVFLEVRWGEVGSTRHELECEAIRAMEKIGPIPPMNCEHTIKLSIMCLSDSAPTHQCTIPNISFGDFSDGMKPNPRRGFWVHSFLISRTLTFSGQSFFSSPPSLYLPPDFPFLSPLPFPPHNFFFGLFILLSLVFHLSLFFLLFSRFVYLCLRSQKTLFLIFNFVSLFEVFVVFLFFYWFLFCFCLCIKLGKRRTGWKKKKGRKRRKWRATWRAPKRGESLTVQPLQTNNRSRGLLPFSWALNCNKGLLLSLGFSDFFLKYLFLYFFHFFFLFIGWFFLSHFFSISIFSDFSLFSCLKFFLVILKILVWIS